MLNEGKFYEYLLLIDRDAEEMFLNLINQILENGSIIEKFKDQNQMEWVKRMNNIRQRATEIVNSELIYN
ncbi:MAG: TnpV protein [Clostridia bacterium]|nr:TnpV protein [Clostridia bacterium]